MRLFVVCAAFLLAHSAAHAAPLLVNTLTISGDATDLAAGSGANQNRLGGFFSDLAYDRDEGVYYGLVDRGPGGGTIGYDARVQKFRLKVHPVSGKISKFRLTDTIGFRRDDGKPYNGLRPDLDPLNGDRSVLGRSLDAEGLAVSGKGQLYVSDEYGPAVREFNRKGVWVRDFATPENLIPKRADNSIDYAAGRPTIVLGRQDNRGYEGLAMAPDGKTFYAMLQDPLVNEGSSNDGRRSPNLRIVQYDARTGLPGAQYIYVLEPLADINARVTGDTFGATAQGRNIGISAIIAVNEHEFLVLERDNRGVGVEDALGTRPVASKRIYKIDLRDATDVSALSLANTSTLPPGVVPVAKALYFDVNAALQAAGLPVPEKLEGLAIGPRLRDGSYALLLGTDNDFSVTQNGAGVQFDVCADGTQVPIDSGCTAGLLPTYLYAIKADGLRFVPPRHTPGKWPKEPECDGDRDSGWPRCSDD